MTRAEIEATVFDGVIHFAQQYMGRRPVHVCTFLLGDLLVVRLQGVLASAERQLVTSMPSEKGRDLLKRVRTQLVETARPVLETLVQNVTGVEVVSLHHDLSTSTGEEVIVFTLAKAPELFEVEPSY